MKKKFTLFLSIALSALLLFSLCGCRREVFFKQWVLDDSHVPELPCIEYTKAKKKYYRVYRYAATRDAYEKYVEEVFAYLSAQNFTYFGTCGSAEDPGLFMGFTTYEFIPCTELEEFQYGNGYTFVWADELSEDNKLVNRSYLDIYFDETDEYTVTVDLSYALVAFRLAGEETEDYADQS